MKSMDGLTTQTVLHVSTLTSDRPQVALHSFSFFCHDNTSVISRSAIHAFGAHRICNIWTQLDVQVARSRLGNACLLSRMRDSFSNMTESVEYHCSSLLRELFAVMILF